MAVAHGSHLHFCGLLLLLRFTIVILCLVILDVYHIESFFFGIIMAKLKLLLEALYLVAGGLRPVFSLYSSTRLLVKNSSVNLLYSSNRL